MVSVARPMMGEEEEDKQHMSEWMKGLRGDKITIIVERVQAYVDQ